MTDSTDYLAATLLTLPDDERVNLERALVDTARAAALGELTADISHDLANPLFAVMGLVELLLMDAVPRLGGEAPLAHPEDESRAEGRPSVLARLRTSTRGRATHRARRRRTPRGAARLPGRGKELEVNGRYPDEPLLVPCPAPARTGGGPAAAGGRAGHRDSTSTCPGARSDSSAPGGPSARSSPSGSSSTTAAGSSASKAR